MPWIGTIGQRMIRTYSNPTKQVAELPDISTNNEFRPQGPARRRWQNARDPPSSSRFPARFTGLRMPRKAQLALIADARSPSSIATALFPGNSVAMATKGILRSANVLGRYSVQNRSSTVPCKSLGQKMLRASPSISRQVIPAPRAAPTLSRLAALHEGYLSPPSDHLIGRSRFTTPDWTFIF